MPINKRQKEYLNSSHEKLPLSGNLYKKNQRRISFFKLSRLIFVSGSLVALVVISIYMIFANTKSSAESVNQTTIVTQLAKQIDLPEEEVVSMMRVSNAKDLTNQDIFYKNVKNGDYIIVYKSMVILYDFDKSVIKNIKTY